MDIAYLDNRDFTNDGRLKIPGTVFCLVYANWCPPCMAFKPTFHKLVDHVKHKMKVCCIEMDGKLAGQKELADRIHQVIPQLQGTPTIVMFSNGKLVEVYDGDRSLGDLVKFTSNY